MNGRPINFSIQTIIVILFTVTQAVNVILVMEFIRSKRNGNNTLRALLIAYFSVEAFVIALYNVTAYYVYAKYGINILYLLITAMIPKAIVKVFIFNYLQQINNGKN